MSWYLKTGVLVALALIFPYLYRKLRPDEPVIKEGTYPLKSDDAATRFGKFEATDLSAADAPTFGPSQSSPSRYAEMAVQNEWLHPDVTRRRRLWEEKRKAERDEA